MLNLSFGTVLALDVILTVIHVFAICITIFRVYYRTITRRFWWDDFVAFLAMIVDCGYLAALWFDRAPPGSILQTHNGRVAQYWIGLMFFVLVVWMTRISLALAIARIFPPPERTRRFAIGMSLLSIVFCLVIVIQSAVVCSKEPELNVAPEAACQWPDSLRTLIVVANIFSDSLLIVTPLYKLWRVRLPRKQRRLILTAFAAGASTTTVTVACAVFQFAPVRWEPAKTTLRGKLTCFETGVSLIVCNLLIVMSYLYTVFLRREDLEMTEGSSETCDSWPSTVDHSNMIPESSLASYTFTEITDSTGFTDIGCVYHSTFQTLPHSQAQLQSSSQTQTHITQTHSLTHSYPQSQNQTRQSISGYPTLSTRSF